MRVPTFTFSGGVLSKGLWGRVDLNKYLTGLKTARNFLVGVEGGAYKRHGLYFVGKPKFQDRECKLVPWKIANDDSYILEFGHQYIRFIRFGGHISMPPGHVPAAGSDAISVSGFMEVPSPYTEDQVRELKFTFANDIAYIFHKDHQPRQLRRMGLYDWDLTLQNFNPHGTAPTGLTAVWQHRAGGVWQTTDMNEPDYDENPESLEYKISATMANGLETMSSAKVAVQGDLGHRSFRVLLSWAAKPGALQYTLYKGKNGIFGFIGYVDAGVLTYEDRNFAPSYDVVPYKPFEGFGVSQWPRVGEFYKQRLSYAATEDEAQTIWFSRPLFFDSMTTSLPIQDDDSIKVPLVGRERQTINHMVQLKKFIVFTDAGEWVVAGADDQALTTATVDPVQETAYGSDPYLNPKAVGDRILFVEAISGAIRDMGYEFTSNAYKADDLSRLARDLFKNKTITAWDYSAFPGNLFSCVCTDGSLPTMTYVREHEIWGWSMVETEGKFIDTASVPEIDQHANYFQVIRNINGVPTRFIERTEVSGTERIEDMFYVDCGLSYYDLRTFTDLIKLESGEVQFTRVGHIRSVGDELHLETDDFSMRFIVTAVTANEVIAKAKYNKPVPTIIDQTGYMFICSAAFSGFEHLAGVTNLIALADGKVVRNITVAPDGTFTLPFKAARLHAGLPYDAELETLDLDDERAAGRYIPRAINRITMRLQNSRGVFAGSSKSPRELTQIEPRSDEDYDEANRALDGIYDIPAHTAWDQTCGVMVRSYDPLPVNVLNIVPDIEYGN